MKMRIDIKGVILYWYHLGSEDVGNDATDCRLAPLCKYSRDTILKGFFCGLFGVTEWCWILEGICGETPSNTKLPFLFTCVGLSLV